MNNITVYPTYFFFVLNSFEDVHQKVGFISSLSFFNTRIPSFFILNFDVEIVDVQNFMKQVWKKYSLLCLGVFFYKPDVQLSTYQPFKRIVVNLTDIEEFKDYFMSHEYANLNGKVFDLAVFNNPPRNIKKGSKLSGEDPKFWIDLIHSLNASWNLIQIKNFSYEDAIHVVGDGEADFCPYRYFPTENYPNIEYLTPFAIDYLVEIVPNSQKLPQYSRVLNDSNPTFWVLTLASFILPSLVISIAGKFFNKQTEQVTLCVFGICLNQPVKRLASYQVIQIFLMNLWQFSCLIISATFQASLLDSLLISKYDLQIDKI